MVYFSLLLLPALNEGREWREERRQVISKEEVDIRRDKKTRRTIYHSALETFEACVVWWASLHYLSAGGCFSLSSGDRHCITNQTSAWTEPQMQIHTQRLKQRQQSRHLISPIVSIAGSDDSSLDYGCPIAQVFYVHVMHEESPDGFAPGLQPHLDRKSPSPTHPPQNLGNQFLNQWVKE